MGTVPIWKQWLIIAASVLFNPVMVLARGLSPSIIRASGVKSATWWQAAQSTFTRSPRPKSSTQAGGQGRNHGARSNPLANGRQARPTDNRQYNASNASRKARLRLGVDARLSREAGDHRQRSQPVDGIDALKAPLRIEEQGRFAGLIARPRRSVRLRPPQGLARGRGHRQEACGTRRAAPGTPGERR